MRPMTIENWKNEGDIWRGKVSLIKQVLAGLAKDPGPQYWHLTPTHHLIRPIFTRPTHPLHMKPVSTASENMEPVTKAGKGDKYEALGTLGKKAKKPRSLPPKRAMRMILDPYRYGQMHLAGAFLAGADSDLPSPAEGTWEFQYEDVRDNDISSQLDPSLVSGKWVYRARDHTQDNAPQTDTAKTQVVPGKRKRVAEQLGAIAATSVFPDTLQDVEGKQINKKAKTGASMDIPRPALEEEDMPILDDDDIWGSAPTVDGQEAVSLFDANTSKKGHAAVAPAPVGPKTVSKPAATIETASLSDVEFLDDDLLFGETEEVRAQVSSLFASDTISTQNRKPEVEMSSDDESVEAIADKATTTGSGMSLSKFARSEKQKGLSVLQALGIDFAGRKESAIEPDEGKAISFEDDEDADDGVTAAPTGTKSQAAWLYDDDDDEDDVPVDTVAGKGVMRLRGGGSGNLKGERDNDEDDSDSDSSSESEEEPSSSDKPEAEKGNGSSEHRGNGKQSLKDMFVAQPECE